MQAVDRRVRAPLGQPRDERSPERDEPDHEAQREPRLAGEEHPRDQQADTRERQAGPPPCERGPLWLKAGVPGALRLRLAHASRTPTKTRMAVAATTRLSTRAMGV